MSYKIIRFFQDENRENEVITTVATLEQAQAHCNDPESSSSTAIGWDAYTASHGEWFDGYTRVTDDELTEPVGVSDGERRYQP